MPNEGKVAIVTGASRGIGKATAIQLANAGFDVAICARTVVQGDTNEHSPNLRESDTSPLPGSLAETAAEISGLGRKALPVKVDLESREDLKNLVDQTLKEFGRIDLVVNNAAYMGPGWMDPFVDTTVEVFEKHIRCNLLAPYELCRLVVPAMIEGGGGVIINLTSMAAWHEAPGMPGQGGVGVTYTVSKAALNRLSIGLAKELRQHNIAVVNVHPGFVATERMAQDMVPRGTPIERAVPRDVPASTCVAIATSRYPMVFSGKTIDAPVFAAEHQLVDAGELPGAFGPESWGLPAV